MRPDPGHSTDAWTHGISARLKLFVALAAGLLAGAGAAVSGAGRMTPLIGWDVLAVVFGGWTWRAVWPLDPAKTRAHAQKENPSRDLADALLLGAAVASLVAVGLVLFGASHAPGNNRYWQAALSVLSVFISWTIVHTVF